MLAVLPVLLAGAPAAAQDHDILLASVEQEYARLARHHGLANARAMDRALARLGTLRYAPPEVRRKAVSFLKSVAGSRGTLGIFRVRVTAVNLLVDISQERDVIDALLKLARRKGDETLVGLDFFIERALTRVDSIDQVRYLVKHLSDSRDALVRLCLGALARLKNDELVIMALPETARIVDLARSGPIDIRERALLLLGRLPDERALAPVAAALNHKKAIIRMAAAKALGGMADRRGVEVLLSKLLADPAPRVREEAIRSLGRFPDEAPVPLLIEQLGREQRRLRCEIGKSLEALTGQEFGEDVASWRTWWRDRSPESTSRPAPFQGQKPRYARYYGIPVNSDRIVFILDISGSMDFKERKKGPTRLDLAKKELAKVLKQLTPETRFNIVTFSWTTNIFKRKGLVPASRRQVREALKFVNRQRPNGGTNTHEALKTTFESFPAADTIYLLSDGSPTVGNPVTQEQILHRVHLWNRVRGVRIHGIALLSGDAPDLARRWQDDKEDARRFMKMLAFETGGTFVRRP